MIIKKLLLYFIFIYFQCSAFYSEEIFYIEMYPCAFQRSGGFVRLTCDIIMSLENCYKNFKMRLGDFTEVLRIYGMCIKVR